MKKPLDVEEVSKRLVRLLDECRGTLSESAVDEVMHYIDHAEPEIAFEGLFLELIAANCMPPAVDRAACLALAEDLNLKETSVLDDQFWTRFVSFMSTHR